MGEEKMVIRENSSDLGTPFYALTHLEEEKQSKNVWKHSFTLEVVSKKLLPAAPETITNVVTLWVHNSCLILTHPPSGVSVMISNLAVSYGRVTLMMHMI